MSSASTAFIELSDKAWNVHVHCFDPEQFPYREARSYTPPSATLESLVDACLTKQVVLVQASVEDGHTSLLAHLKLCGTRYPLLRMRGIILATSEVMDLNEAGFEELHGLGVRGIRLHGLYGGSGNDARWVQQQLCKLANLYAVRKLKWSISAQLPLTTWISLKNFILETPTLQTAIIVAEHNGCVTPADIGPDFDIFLELLKANVYVKIGALHRRSGDIACMEALVKRMADSAPDALVWGSDWPHVNTNQKGLSPNRNLEGVDTAKELAHLRSWLSEHQWQKMLVTNPEHLYGS
jgi:predicted TIM-barrel fold metal-dependent hydrolase